MRIRSCWSLNVKDIGGTKLECQESTLGYMQWMTGEMRAGIHEFFTEFGDPSRISPVFSGPDTDDQVIPSTVVIGAGFDIDLLKVLRMQLLADFTFEPASLDTLFNGEREETVWKNIHVGTELDLLDTVQVRAGLNQGYLTGGIGFSFLRFFNLFDMRLDMTYYSWEMGSYAGHHQSEALKCDVTISL